MLGGCNVRAHDYEDEAVQRESKAEANSRTICIGRL